MWLESLIWQEGISPGSAPLAGLGLSAKACVPVWGKKGGCSQECERWQDPSAHVFCMKCFAAVASWCFAAVASCCFLVASLLACDGAWVQVEAVGCRASAGSGLLGW